MGGVEKRESQVDSDTKMQPKARNKHLLVPKGQTGSSCSGVKDRMKNPKLVGADIYVVRLNNNNNNAASEQNTGSTEKRRKGDRKRGRRQCERQFDGKLDADDEEEEQSSDACSIASKEFLGTTPPGSLHDELTLHKSRSSSSSEENNDEAAAKTGCGGQTDNKQRMVGESRPCYRCVSYMHSAGIKRVFWTNSEGMWEGAKVRDLIDQLEGTMKGDGADAASLGLPSPEVFVTKHEVLLLRRLMMGD